MIAHHAIARINWLRASALRVNCGIVATAGLLIGVAAAAASEADVVLAGMVGLLAGALALGMAEYARTAGQAEAAAGDDNAEDPVAHHRSGPQDDLIGAPGEGLGDFNSAHALPRAIMSAGAYGVGGALPLAAASAFKLSAMPLGVGLVSLAGSALLAAAGARAAGLHPTHCVARALTWGGGAMAAAFAVGRIFGVPLLAS